MYDNNNIYSIGEFCTHTRAGERERERERERHAFLQSYSFIEPFNNLRNNVFLSVLLHEGMPHFIAVHQSFVI